MAKRIGLLTLGLLVLCVAPAFALPPFKANLNILYFPGAISPPAIPWNGWGQISIGNNPQNGIGTTCMYYVYLEGANPPGYSTFDPTPFPFQTAWQDACYTTSGKCQYEIVMQEASGCTGNYTETVVIPLEADNYTEGGNPYQGNASWMADDISNVLGYTMQTSKGGNCSGQVTSDSPNNVLSFFQTSWMGSIHLVGNMNTATQCDH